VSRRNRPSGGGAYYRVNCGIVLLFGLTELEAVAAWRENVGPLRLFFLLHPFYLWRCQGVERRSTAKIIYDPDESDLTRTDDARRLVGIT